MAELQKSPSKLLYVAFIFYANCKIFYQKTKLWINTSQEKKESTEYEEIIFKTTSALLPKKKILRNNRPKTTFPLGLYVLKIE